jgi:YfiH family protein
MRQVAFQSLVYYQFQSLLPYPETAHGIFTRLGGRSRPPWASLNTGHGVGDDPEAVEANHHLICQSLGFRMEDLASPHQVHGTTVGIVDERDKGQIRPQTDALATVTPGVLLMLRFADCTPIMLYDPKRRAIGLVHAGWRGTVAGVTRAAVEAMVTSLGCRPADIVAGIGPSIGPCCYEVGEDVVHAVRKALPNVRQPLVSPAGDRWHLDLWMANRHQLMQAGVRQIEVAEICTACHADEWFSHRAERGKTGRFGAAIGFAKDL